MKPARSVSLDIQDINIITISVVKIPERKTRKIIYFFDKIMHTKYLKDCNIYTVQKNGMGQMKLYIYVQ